MMKYTELKKHADALSVIDQQDLIAFCKHVAPVCMLHHLLSTRFKNGSIKTDSFVLSSTPTLSCDLVITLSKHAPVYLTLTKGLLKMKSFHRI